MSTENLYVQLPRSLHQSLIARFDYTLKEKDPETKMWQIPAPCPMCDYYKRKGTDCGACPLARFGDPYGCWTWIVKVAGPIPQGVFLTRQKVLWPHRSDRQVKEWLERLLEGIRKYAIFTDEMPQRIEPPVSAAG